MWRTLYRLNVVLLVATAALLVLVPRASGAFVITVISVVLNVIVFVALTAGIRTGTLSG